jgi:hypothetical protein
MNPTVAVIRPADPGDPQMITIQVDVRNSPQDIATALADALAHALPEDAFHWLAAELVERLETRLGVELDEPPTRRTVP